MTTLATHKSDAQARSLDTVSRRRSVLTAALGFLQWRHQSPELVPLRRGLDSWRGMGDLVVGLNLTTRDAG
jgi:hypothetical protein